MKRQLQRIGRYLARGRLEADTRDAADRLNSELHRRALERSADYVEAHLGKAVFCRDRFEVLTHAMARREPGPILEFGVFSGKTINHMAGLALDERLFGFDSFEGLPEEWSGYRYSEKNFDLGGRQPDVASNVTLVPGWFEDTLPTFLASQAFERVSVLHIDCDIYSSARTILDNLSPRLKPGSIMIMDEFFNYPGFEKHEFRAFHEFVEAFGVVWSPLAYAGNQLSLRIDEMNPGH